ncbi:MAG: hypothetical protein KH347_01075 [Acetobacter sp.]|nr:hypothetical protein [Acetobacter sp.]
MTNTHTNESGRSMIEMLGVLAIIGVLSVGGIAGYSQAMSKFKVSKTTDQVQTMVTNIRTLFAGQRTYSGLETASTAYTMGIYTDETYKSGAANGTNAYGGSIILGGYPAAAPHNFTITYNSLPQDACVRMAMSDWGDASSGLVGLLVQGTEQATAPTAEPTGDNMFLTAAKAVPIPLDKAITACKGDNDNTSSITWIYR